MSAAPSIAASPTADDRLLAPRLRRAVVGVRSEFDVSRHVFKDGVGYVVRDPVSFRSHRFGADDYAVLCSLTQDRTLDDAFGALVADGHLAREDEESFYGFILDLHRQGLLTLPINDAEALYQRAERKRLAARRARAMSVFFLRIPLFNPERLLSRLAPLTRVLFTRWALGAWLILMACAGTVAAMRWDELAAPLLATLSGDNLFLLWGTLIGLKVVHEFGHAFACRAFGGHVPEMGAFLILFTPCAYVDATDSWSFPERWKRVVVSLAGVGFESVAGVAALFVWAVTGPGVVNTVAYQAVVLSTVVTVGFNLNPLTKYDGYYILSDLFGVPNLRAKAQGEVSSLLRRIALGRAADTEPVRRWLLAFGIAAAAYRVVLVMSICALIAMKFYFVGLALAGAYLLVSVLGGVVKAVRFLRHAELPPELRLRAALMTALVAVAAPAGVLMAPVPMPVAAWGIVEREHEVVLRAPEAARLTSLAVRAGDTVGKGAIVAALQSPAVDAEVAETGAMLEAARRVLRRDRAVSLAGAGPAAGEVERWEARLGEVERRARALDVSAVSGGEVVGVTRAPLGTVLGAGEELATVVSGAWRATIFLDEFAFAAASLHEGDRVPCRPATDPAVRLWGVVERIEPVGTRQLGGEAGRPGASSSVVVHGADGSALLPHFRVVVRLEDGEGLARGTTLRVRLDAEAQPLGRRALRSIERFLMKVRVSHS